MAQEFGVAPGAIAFWEQGERTVPGPALKLLALYEEELGLSPKKRAPTQEPSAGRKFWAAGSATSLAAQQLLKILPETSGITNALISKTGEWVAVKIQYPGIEKSLISDLEQVVSLESLACLFFRSQEKGVILEEVREKFLSECDYRNEAANQCKLADLFSHNPKVQIPRVFSELSTKRVLVTE